MPNWLLIYVSATVVALCLSLCLSARFLCGCASAFWWTYQDSIVYHLLTWLWGYEALGYGFQDAGPLLLAARDLIMNRFVAKEA